jgi:hypothetical protein
MLLHLPNVEGANVKARDGCRGTVLQEVAYEGYKRMAHMLPEDGANVKVPGGRHGVLHGAAMRGHTRILGYCFTTGQLDVDFLPLLTFILKSPILCR